MPGPYMSPGNTIFYPVPRKISTILHRFYKTDTNQPRCGTDPGQPVPGSQGQGLTDRTVEACDMAVRIPMTDRVESLNAAVAGSVLLWHFRGV